MSDWVTGAFPLMWQWTWFHFYSWRHFRVIPSRKSVYSSIRKMRCGTETPSQAIPLYSIENKVPFLHIFGNLSNLFWGAFWWHWSFQKSFWMLMLHPFFFPVKPSLLNHPSIRPSIQLLFETRASLIWKSSILLGISTQALNPNTYLNPSLSPELELWPWPLFDNNHTVTSRSLSDFYPGRGSKYLLPSKLELSMRRRRFPKENKSKSRTAVPRQSSESSTCAWVYSGRLVYSTPSSSSPLRLPL